MSTLSHKYFLNLNCSVHVCPSPGNHVIYIHTYRNYKFTLSLIRLVANFHAGAASSFAPLKYFNVAVYSIKIDLKFAQVTFRHLESNIWDFPLIGIFLAIKKQHRNFKILRNCWFLHAIYGEHLKPCDIPSHYFHFLLIYWSLSCLENIFW